VYVRPAREGKILSFGVSGKLWKDALIMYDRETDSLWSHVTGTAIKGKLTGTRLKIFPAIHTTWAEWKRLYPGSLVLTKESRYGLTGVRNSYESYFADPDRLGIFGTRNPDQTLPGKEFVVGLVRENTAVAYPFRYLSGQPLVNDLVGRQPALVVFSARSSTGVIFSRKVRDRVLTFANLRREKGELWMDDIETKSTWRALSGEAIQGKLAGSRLEPLPSTLSFWFAWKGFYPSTIVWKP
jgi:hypothetical protein